MMPTPWLVRPPGPPRRLRLYCFPFAGGSASVFAGWQEALGPGIEVCAIQLPGRGARMAEAPLSDLGEVVRQIVSVIASQPRMPFAFFGHSLGGLLAFEVARYCMLHYLPLPVHLFASGCAAPQHRDRERKLHLLPDEELIEALKDYNGTPAEVLGNFELMALLLPLLRADFALVENYRYRPSLRLSVPITVLAGRQDAHIEEMHVDGWSKETSGPCQVHWFEGDHFFIQSERAAVIDLTRTTLAAAVCE